MDSVRIFIEPRSLDRSRPHHHFHCHSGSPLLANVHKALPYCTAQLASVSSNLASLINWLDHYLPEWPKFSKPDGWRALSYSRLFGTPFALWHRCFGAKLLWFKVKPDIPWLRSKLLLINLDSPSSTTGKDPKWNRNLHIIALFALQGLAKISGLVPRPIKKNCLFFSSGVFARVLISNSLLVFSPSSAFPISMAPKIRGKERN